MTTVAVVDDSEIELEIIANTLRKEGITCLGINHPEDAVVIIAETQPDMVILDVQMPKISGLDLCKSLKSNPTTKDIPIIMLSGDVSSDSIIASLHLGVIDYIPKPCAMKNLVDIVKQHDIVNKIKHAWEPAKIELERIINKYGGDRDDVQIWEKERRTDGRGRRATDKGCPLGFKHDKD